MNTNAELFQLAVEHHQNGNRPQAEFLYRQILQADPQHFAAHTNLGVLLHQSGRTREALDSFATAVQLNPNQADAQNNLGNALRYQGQVAAAVEAHRAALRIEPNNAVFHFNLGSACKELGQFAAAMEEFDHALRLDPDLAEARLSRGILSLLTGDFEKGWPDYEYRWKEGGAGLRPFAQARWDGSSLAGKTILLHAEQGLGDTIQFIRYAPFVKQRGGSVLFECQTALVPLLDKVAGVDEIVFQGRSLPAFDVHLPLLSLPGILRTTPANIPTNIPYLTADPILVEKWRQEITRLTSLKAEPLNIGIVWQGSPTHKEDRYRSVPLAHFATLAKLPGVRLLSLQVGPQTKQFSACPFPIVDLGGGFDMNSLADLAGVLMNLDLVVTVDTALAHLAGALGVPAWVALTFVPDWRWLLDRADSSWYPTLRLFRQKQRGNWGELFERIAAALGEIIRNGLR